MSDIEKPLIVGLSSKANVLRRRLQHLQSQADSGRYNEKSLPYLMAEIYALSTAIQVIEWYSDDRRISPETSSPLSVLMEFSALDLDDADNDERLFELQQKAKDLVGKVA